MIRNLVSLSFSFYCRCKNILRALWEFCRKLIIDGAEFPFSFKTRFLDWLWAPKIIYEPIQAKSAAELSSFTAFSKLCFSKRKRKKSIMKREENNERAEKRKIIWNLRLTIMLYKIRWQHWNMSENGKREMKTLEKYGGKYWCFCWFTFALL